MYRYFYRVQQPLHDKGSLAVAERLSDHFLQSIQVHGIQVFFLVVAKSPTPCVAVVEECVVSQCRLRRQTTSALRGLRLLLTNGLRKSDIVPCCLYPAGTSSEVHCTARALAPRQGHPWRHGVTRHRSGPARRAHRAHHAPAVPEPEQHHPRPERSGPRKTGSRVPSGCGPTPSRTLVTGIALAGWGKSPRRSGQLLRTSDARGAQLCSAPSGSVDTSRSSAVEIGRRQVGAWTKLSNSVKSGCVHTVRSFLKKTPRCG
jgi:hypothetical protein